ncbi:MarR family winged helix-turn-helix transcriptional regulator [Kitasatospora sp. HPMI-4]|uniref:MarR family winged helix-turn-helix transcriptional regulator n=1 Tax=Kitasatospora sp. HPMI-4 TaxID=3448443 RepID=UPI003F1CCD61
MPWSTSEGAPTPFGRAARSTPQAPAGTPHPGVPHSVVASPRLLGRLYRVVALWKAQLEPVLKDHGITAANFHVLATLRRAGPSHRLTTSQMAAIDQVTCSGMTVRADSLERKGLIIRERDEHDRRIIHLRLTQRGLDLVDLVLTHHRALEEQLMADLDDSEHHAITALLDRLERSLRHYAEEPVPGKPN